VKRVIPAALLLPALLLSACATDPAAAYSDSARQTLAEMAALDGDERTDVALAYASEAESDARLAFGIDQALGGTAAADAVIESLYAPLDDLRNAGGPEITFAPASVSEAGSGVATFIGLAFWMVGQLGKGAMDLADNGEVGTDTSSDMGGESTISITPEGAVESSFTASGTEGKTTVGVKATTDLQTCPSADGTLELTGTSDMRIAVGSVGMRVELEVVANVRLDDTATIVESDYTYRHQTSSTADGKGEFFDHSAGDRTELTVNRSSGATTVEFAQSAIDSAAALANMVAMDMIEVAQRGWESGRCISLTLTPSEDPGSLEPSSEVTIEAAPTAVTDGQPAGGSVVASLSGEGSLSPDGSTQDAPATLTYTAADEKDRAGTVTVESRSKRGVGKATITLETGGQAFHAQGGADGLSVTGKICSLTTKFTLAGGGMTFTFTPGAGDDGTDGAFRVTGVEEGVSYLGDGRYTVDRDKDYTPTSITLDGEISLSTDEGNTATSPADMTLALIPTEPC
jgi:hypothetical protein